jgi:hypothetical protein
MNEAFFKRFGGGAEQQAAPAAQQSAPAEQQAAPASNDFMSRFGKNLDPAQSAPSIYDSSEEGASPETALNVSPVGVADRAAIGIGNQAGALQYLKTKFDDAQVTKEGAIVVKKGNTWHQVDPSGLGGGSLLDKAKEFGKDVSDLGDVAANAIGSSVGAAVGLFAGGAGAIPGAGIGGGLAATARIQAAKYLGTYSATPEDELKDIGLEAILSAGGEGIARGIKAVATSKPVVDKVGLALDWIKNNASPAAKEAVATMISAVNPEIKKDSAKALVENGKAVMSKLDSAISAVKESDAAVPLNVQETLKKRAGDAVGALFDKPRRALSAVFDREEKELLANVPAGFQAEVAPAINKAMGGLAERGFVKPIVKSESGEIVGYKLGDMNAINEQLKHAYSNGADGMKVMRDLKQFVDLANERLQKDGLKGADAAESIIQTRRAFDKFYYTTVRANEAMREALMPISGALRDDLVSTLGKAGTDVANKYAAMNSKYATMLPHVAEADRVMRLYNGKNAFVNKLMGDDASNAKNLVSVMEQLKGKAGTNLATDLNQTVAAQDFVKAFPHLSFKKIGVASAIGYGASHGVLGPLALAGTIPAAAMQSGRLVGRTVAGAQGAVQAASSAAAASLPYARQFGTLMKSLSTEQMRELMMHPDAFPKLLQGTALASQREEQMKQQLLENHGVIPQQGGDQ